MTFDELEQLAAACEDRGDFAPFDAAVAQAFAEASDATAVWALCSLEGTSGMAFGDGQMPSAWTSAIVERALTLGDAEMLGAAARMAAYEPAALLSDEDWKVKVQADLAAHADALRAAWDAAAEPLRAQIAHVLAVSGAARAEDVARVDALRRATERADVLALAVAIQSRLEVDRAAALALLRLYVGHPDALVRLFSAAGAARLEERLDEVEGRAVVEALQAPTPMPTWWGFRTFDDYENAGEVAKRVLNRARLEDPTPAVEALAARPDAGWRESESLRYLAWPDGFDPLGLVAAELSRAQRRALEAHAAPPLAHEAGALHGLGLCDGDDVAPFLAEAGPRWSVRPVRLPDGLVVRWSMARIWRARVWAEVEHAAAVDALTHPLDPAGLFELTCTEGRGILLQRVGSPRGPEHRARDVGLALACLRAIRASNFDLAAAARAALARRPNMGLIPVTLALLTAMEEVEIDLDAAEWARLAKGVQRAQGDPQVAAVVDALPASARLALQDASAR